MGQYYKIINLDKKQYLNPHKFGDGLKLMEFGSSGDGTMLALAVLLVEGNNRGGGDLRSDHPIVGTWSRNRIVVAGDYADAEREGEFYDPEQDDRTLYSMLDDEEGKPANGWQDVSDLVLSALVDDAYTARALASTLKYRGYRVPEDVRKRLDTAEERADELEGAEPPHVRLAHAVLRAPNDNEMWQVFLDAALEAAGR